MGLTTLGLVGSMVMGSVVVTGGVVVVGGMVDGMIGGTVGTGLDTTSVVVCINFWVTNKMPLELVIPTPIVLKDGSRMFWRWLGEAIKALAIEEAEPPIPTFSPSFFQFSGAPVTRSE